MDAGNSAFESPLDDENVPDLSEEGEETVPGEDEDAGKGNGRGLLETLGRLFGRKRFRAIGVSLFFLVLLCLGGFLGMRFLPAVWNKAPDRPSLEGSPQDYREERLSSFYIPPAEDLGRPTLVVRISVVWDGLASFRFKGRELQIRNRVLDRLTALSREQTGIDESPSLVEAELNKIFRESLKTEDLEVKIQDIKAL